MKSVLTLFLIVAVGALVAVSSQDKKTTRAANAPTAVTPIPPDPMRAFKTPPKEKPNGLPPITEVCGLMSDQGIKMTRLAPKLIAPGVYSCSSNLMAIPAIRDGIIPNRIGYFVEASAANTTEMALKLYLNTPDEAKFAREVFTPKAAAFYRKVTGKAAPGRFVGSVQKGREFSLKTAKATFKAVIELETTRGYAYRLTATP